MSGFTDRHSDRQRILRLLDLGSLTAGTPLQDISEMLPSPSAPEALDQLEVKNRDQAPIPAHIKKTPASPKNKRSLKALLAQISGQKAQVHLQQQQQQEQQREVAQEQAQAQHQAVDQKQEILDARNIVYYQKWKANPQLYSSALTLFQLRVFGFKDPDFDQLWFQWTLDGLKLAHNLDGFMPAALKAITEYPSLFRDGFDFDHLPQGFKDREVLIDGKLQHILFYDPTLPAPTHPFAVKLTKPAARLRKTDAKAVSEFADEKDKALIEDVMNAFYCTSDNPSGNHGLCTCMGCAQKPGSKDPRNLDEKTKAVFYANKRVQPLSLLETLVTSNFQAMPLKLKTLKKNSVKKDVGAQFLAGLFYGWNNSLDWGEDFIYWSYDSKSPLYHQAVRIKEKHFAELLKRKTGLSLPASSDEAAWKTLDYKKLADARQQLKAAQKQGTTEADTQLVREISQEVFADWKQAVAQYEQSLEDQRTACYGLLWGERSADALHKEFPVLKQFSLRYLRSLIEVAAKFDFEPGYGDKPKPEIVEALLNKFAELSRLDKRSKSFDLLFSYVLQPSDNWITTLFTDDNQLAALSGICRLTPQRRDNWNWLLERHGHSVGYADLQHLWAAFQYFESEYVCVMGKLPPLDFTKFPPESIKNAYLFLDFLLIALINANDKEAQRELFMSGKIPIDQSGPVYASRRQKYSMLAEGMGLHVDPEAKQRAREMIIYGPGKVPGRYGHLYMVTPAVDYTIKREQLGHTHHCYAENLYRYIGQQSHTALKFSFYQSCMEQELKTSQVQAGIFPPDFVLFAIATAHERAADFNEGVASQRLWQELRKRRQDPFIHEAVKGFLNWYYFETTPTLTFVETMTLIRLWEEALGLKQGLRMVAFGAEQQNSFHTLAYDTQGLISSPLYGKPFLRVLREVYAAPNPSPSLLALDEYIKGIEILKFVLKVSPYQQPHASPVPTKGITDLQWSAKLCEFMSRLSPAPSTPNWKKIASALGKLHEQATAEGYSVAKRVIVMLAGLPPGSLSGTELLSLLQNIPSFLLKAGAKNKSAVSDLDLFEWLKAQGNLYTDLQYPGLQRNVVHSPWEKQLIQRLLIAYRVKSIEHEALALILGRLWDPEQNLLNREAQEQTTRNQLIEEHAARFLGVLLHKGAVWGKRNDALLGFLAEHPQLENYSFSFLERLLAAVNTLPYIDADLRLFHKLLPRDHPIPANLQPAFANAVEKMCELKNLHHSQRERLFSLLHFYAVHRYYQNLPLSELTQYLVDFNQTYSQAYPRATEDMLTVLDRILKDESVNFLAAFESFQGLKTKLEAPSKQAPTDEHKQHERKEAGPSQPKPPQSLPDLLHGLAGKQRGAESKGMEAPDLLRILQESADQATPVPVLEILAIHIGRKDSGPEIQQFLALLKGLHQHNLAAFKLLQQLSQHPPKLGIKTLLTALQSEGQLLDESALVSKLHQLEIDPHGLGGRPQNDPFDLAKIASKIALVTDPARHADGQPRALFGSQQQELLDRVNAVQGFGTEVPAFRKETGEFVPASQLTQAELAKQMAAYRRHLSQPDLSKAEQEKILLLGIALMRQAMYRSPKKLFADDTQITAVCSTMVAQDGMRFTQVDPGQGKTLINAFNAACGWLLKGQVLVSTSDSGLAARDLANNTAFFELLGIPVADKIVTQTSTATDYCIGGVTYTTCAGIELSEQNTALEGNSQALRAEDFFLVVDEVDDAFFDDATYYRSTRLQVESDSQGESPIAIYYQAMVAHFLDSLEYKALLADEKASAAEGSEEKALQLLKHFLLHLPAEYESSRQQKEILLQLLDDNPDQLKRWFISLVRAKRMKEGVDFVCVEMLKLIDGELVGIKKVCPYTTSGRGNPDMQFSDGLQQMAQAMKYQATKDRAFLIQQEAKVFLSSDNNSLFNKGYAGIVGTTATVGSAKRISQRLRFFPARVRIIPPHQKRNRVDHPAQLCADAKTHEAALKAQVRDCLAKDPNSPILIICSHAKQLEEWIKPWVDQVLAEQKLSELKIHVQKLTGDEKSEEEHAITKRSGQPRTLTIATSLAGRGFDVILKQQAESKQQYILRDLIVGPPMSEDKEVQCRGRAARRDDAGETFFIINQKDLVTKEGKPVLDLKAFYAANEDWDYRDWQLRSYSGYVVDAIKPRFLAMDKQVLQLGDPPLCAGWREAHSRLLQNLHQRWEELKEEKNLIDLWQKDRAAYEAMLSLCQNEFLAYACASWEDTLTSFSQNLSGFEKKSRVKHEQEQKRASEQDEKRSAAAKKLDGQESKQTSPSTPVLPEQKWQETALYQQLQVLKPLMTASSFTQEALAEKIPKKQLPYLDLPLPTDAQPRLRETLFSNQAKVCYDLLAEKEREDTPALKELKQKALDYERATIALQLGDEKKEHQEERLLLPNEAVRHALHILVSPHTKALIPTMPREEADALIRKALARDCPDLLVTEIAIGKDRVFKTEDFNIMQEGVDPRDCRLSLVTIKHRSGEATFSISVYIDWIHGRVVLPCGPDLPLSFEIESAEPAAVGDSKVAELLTPPAVAPDIAVEKPLIQRKIPWSWLVFALLCLVGGGAFTVTGFAASLGVPVGLAAWTLSAGFSLATLSIPGFWILAGIGAGYGLAAFLLIFGLMKIGQALMRRVQEGSSSHTPPEVRKEPASPLVLPDNPEKQFTRVLPNAPSHASKPGHEQAPR